MDPLVLQKIQKALDSLIREKVLSLNAASTDALELSFVAPNSDSLLQSNIDTSFRVGKLRLYATNRMNR